MLANKKLFLSIVSSEFASHRVLLTSDLKRPNLDVAAQEDFGVLGRTTLEKLDTYIRQCDAVVHLIGKATGSVPEERAVAALLAAYPDFHERLPPLAEHLRRPQPGFSYTQWEAYLAIYHGRPLFVYRPADFELDDLNVPRDERFTFDAAEAKSQRDHYKRISALGHDRGEFLNQERLSSAVLRDSVEILPRLEAKTPVDVSHFDVQKYAPVELIGRKAEIALLDDAWAKVRRDESPRPHIFTFVALGGEGKTSLVAKWAADLAYHGWPECDGVFAWSFYSQGTREQVAASSDLFLKEALTFFGDAEMADSAAGAFDKGRRLAQLIGERRALLILDGLEPLQYAPTSPTPGELKDQGLAALLKGLAANSRGLCVLTTRYAIPDLHAFIGRTVKEEKLTRLSTEAGVALLQSMGVKGSLRKTIPSADGRALWNEYEKLVEDVKGHALTLNLLGSYLRDAHAGDIRRRDLIKLEEADAEEQSGHAFHVMDAYVRSLESGGGTAQDQAKDRRALALLQLLGLFDRPATADLLNVLWQPPPIAGLTEPLIGISEAQRNLSLKRLEDAKLLTVNRAEGSGELITLDAHPLLREYFARRVRQQQPEAWLAGHQRLYEHLCATTPDKPQPTLEVLEPLYQAVAHGCQAGLQQEACDKVYLDRILRGREFYSTSKLGAIGSDLGAVACFFEPPWSRVSRALTEAAQAWLLNQAAFRLRALGRLTEALEPMRAGLPIELKRDDRKNAAIRVSNLSELELTLGDVGGAVRDAEQSVTYADRSGDAFWKVASRCKIADALHQAGRRAEAEARFREAEQMQAERQPDYRLLYSVRGFHYCDLQLAGAERAAWQRILDCGGSTPLWDVAERPSVMESLSFGTTIAGAVGDSKESGSARESGGEPPQSKALRAVSHRAAHTLNWYEENKQQWLLDIALDHLTLGRVALYAAILERSAACSPLESSHDQPAPKVLPRGSGVHPALQDASRELDTAVTGLRRAGMQDYVPRGLLIRAWLRSLTCAPIGPESAQSDLDEAWEIAERGPMKLFLADIHLYRARLFFREPAYPWQSPQDDLAAAEKLIDDCGYHRRDEELADAKKAIL